MQFQADLPSVLRDYQQWVTQQGIGCTTGETSGGPTVQNVSGKVQRVSFVQQGGSTVYYLQVEGYNMIFTANLSLSAKLPLVQVGDTITGTYTGASDTVINLQTFDDTSIKLGGNVTPTPVATPTAKS